MTSATQHPTTGRSDDGRSPAEWTTLGITLLLVGALIAALIWRGLSGGETISFTITVDDAAIQQRGDSYQVPFQVQNVGQATAEDVLVHVELLDGDQTLEETELTFRFLGEGETANGVALFTDDPRSYTLEANVTSYLIP